MQDSLTSNADDEIKLGDLFISLWAYKLIIAGTCALGIVFGGFYALNAGKQYSSAAIFKLDQAKSSGISVGGQLGALANIAGLGGGSGATILPTGLVKGRIFIEKLDTRLNFQTDPYFNTHNPNSVDPIWKSFIKSVIGWQKSSTDVQEAIWQGIAQTYSANVSFEEKKDGTVKIVVTHVNPLRAAEIANVVMDEIISVTKNKKNREQDQQLSYLSNTLAKALSDLEVSQSNLKTFALENSALPLESFTAGSLQLDALREQLSRTSELHDAVAELSSMLQKKTTKQRNYLLLRQKFPIVDQVEFRRVLGQNEIISSWSWPEVSSVAAVFATLSERRSRLQSQINASQIDAERSSRALETYAKLERETKIAEATYTVLIEQVKAQSMVAGFRPDKTEVYEYASPSIGPSRPKRMRSLALGAILGLFMGVISAFAFASRRGVYYSKKALIYAAQAKFNASVRSLTPMRKRSLHDIQSLINAKSLPVLRDLTVDIHKSGATQVVVTSSRANLTGNDTARALASYMQSNTMKVAVIDFSQKSEKPHVDPETITIGSFVTVESAGQVSVLSPFGDLAAIDLIMQRDFVKNLQSLNPTFDLIFLCADNGDAVGLLSALEGQKAFHITLARTKHTKSNALTHMHSLLPIQGLLHD